MNVVNEERNFVVKEVASDLTTLKVNENVSTLELHKKEIAEKKTKKNKVFA